jgi:hypothetical protein
MSTTTTRIDVNVRGSVDGCTPLHYAVPGDHYAVVKDYYNIPTYKSIVVIFVN